MNYYFVVPAQAGIQKNKTVIDSRLCGNDVYQSFLDYDSREVQL